MILSERGESKDRAKDLCRSVDEAGTIPLCIMGVPTKLGVQRDEVYHERAAALRFLRLAAESLRVILLARARRMVAIAQ